MLNKNIATNLKSLCLLAALIFQTNTSEASLGILGIFLMNNNHIEYALKGQDPNRKKKLKHLDERMNACGIAQTEKYHSRGIEQVVYEFHPRFKNNVFDCQTMSDLISMVTDFQSSIRAKANTAVKESIAIDPALYTKYPAAKKTLRAHYSSYAKNTTATYIVIHSLFELAAGREPQLLNNESRCVSDSTVMNLHDKKPCLNTYFADEFVQLETQLNDYLSNNEGITLYCLSRDRATSQYCKAVAKDTFKLRYQ